jgi:hypothetical protein
MYLVEILCRASGAFPLYCIPTHGVAVGYPVGAPPALVFLSAAERPRRLKLEANIGAKAKLARITALG